MDRLVMQAMQSGAVMALVALAAFGLGIKAALAWVAARDRIDADARAPDDFDGSMARWGWLNDLRRDGGL